MLTIEDQLRCFAVKVNAGSGCLFQPDSTDYTYVLTVKHNLERKNEDGEKVLMDKEEIKIFRGNVDKDPISKIITYEIHDKLDLALIVIPHVGDSELCLAHSNPIHNEPLILYGYPSRLSEISDEKREDIQCLCGMQREDQSGVEIGTVHGQHTWDINTQKAMLGFSGSGVFANSNGAIVLKGIFPELKDPSGANNKLNIFYISNFDSIAAKLKMQPLIPHSLLSFKPYREKSFHALDPYLKQCMDQEIDKVLNSDITPIKIGEKYKDTLVIPTSEKYADSFSQSKLWVAWLELLTVLKISDWENKESNNSSSVIPLHFSANEHLIKGIIRLFLTDAKLMALMKKNSLITYSSLEEAGSLDYLSRDKVRNIVVKADVADPFGRRMMINQASQVPDFSIIHIKHFQNKIAQIDADDQSPKEILELIKKEIITILNYASN
jgi:hypothetical protein